LLTDRQTNRQTKSGKNITSLAEVIIITPYQQVLDALPGLCLWTLLGIFTPDPLFKIHYIALTYHSCLAGLWHCSILLWWLSTVDLFIHFLPCQFV